MHPHAQLAAEAAEAAGEQGTFWEMHDLLLDHQDALTADGPDAVRRAARPGRRAVRRRPAHATPARRRVAEDVDSADLSGVSGTPTFFINGQRHHGAYDIDTLSAAVKAARAQAVISA